MTNNRCKRPVNGADFTSRHGVQYGTIPLKLLAIPAGFEPATIGLEGRCRIPEFRSFSAFGLQSETLNPFNNSGPM